MYNLGFYCSLLWEFMRVYASWKANYKPWNKSQEPDFRCHSKGANYQLFLLIAFWYNTYYTFYSCIIIWKTQVFPNRDWRTDLRAWGGERIQVILEPEAEKLKLPSYKRITESWMPFLGTLSWLPTAILLCQIAGMAQGKERPGKGLQQKHE